MSDSQPTMADVGEKQFLADLLPHLVPHSRFVNGFGDDASAILAPDGSVVVFKIDRAAAPMAARRGWVDYGMWGRLAVTSNCSDILAGGGAPAAVMIAMILPRDWPAAAATEVIYGCAEECAANDIAFAGGDTKEGQAPVVVGSAIGFASRDRMLTRRGARPGDVIVVAGPLGGFLGSYLQLISAWDPSDEQSHGFDALADPWRDYVSRPRARWAEGAAVRDAGLATAAMDTSDGLYDAIATLTARHGADIDLTALPHHKIAIQCADRLGAQPLNLALGVGDWNIVYTVDPDRWSTFASGASNQDLELTAIGTVSAARGIRWHDAGGRRFRVEPVVNQHFAARLEDESSLLTRLRDDALLIPIER